MFKRRPTKRVQRSTVSGTWMEALEKRVLFNLDLTGYTQTFADEFNGTSVSVTNQNPKGSATYYYWPPYGAAGAYSASQWDTAAISAGGGVMQIKAFKDASGNWHSGNISSMDHAAVGFAQTYGYWEVRAKMPQSGTGSWPAFWLMSKNSILNNLNGTSLPNEEIDIFEWYGTTFSSNPQQPYMQQASHNWTPSPDTAQHLYSPQTPMPGGALPWQDFHTYGVQVDPTHLTWYIDGVQTNQVATPTAYIQSPFYFMVDYALGGGWPLTGVVENSHLDVDYVHVYSLPSTPTAPSGLTATATSSSQINLSWTDNSNNETGFKIERATDSAFTQNLTLVTTTAGNATSYSNTGLAAATTYYYRVRATNSVGDSANSNTANATTQTAGTVPGQVTGLTASAVSNSQINLSWTAVSGATSYNVYRSTTSNGQGTTPVATGITGTSWPNTGLSASTTYYYKVAAVNGAGTGTQSAQASATTQAAGSTNVILNGSFETPALNNNYVLRPTNATWTFTGSAGIQENGSAYSGSTSPAPDGTQTAFLQGNGGTGAMSQSVNLTAGSHALTFYASRRWNTIQPIKVSVDGTQVGSLISPTSNSYTQYTINFTVTAGSHVIMFETTDATGDKTTFIDLVSLV